MRPTTAASMLFAALAGCSSAPVEAPYYARLVVPEEVSVSWIGCELDTDTGLPTNPQCENSPPIAIRTSVRVINDADDVPMNNVRVYFNSGFSNIYLLPQEVMLAVETPDEAGGDGADEWGNVSEEVWAEFASQYAGDYRPTYHEGFTDSVGNAMVWLWIDEMPRDTSGKAVETEIGVSIASEAKVIKLTPAE